MSNAINVNVNINTNHTTANELTCEKSFLIRREAGEATVNKISVPVDLPHTL